MAARPQEAAKCRAVPTRPAPPAPRPQALSLSNPILHNLQTEAGMMAALRHPNIVGFLGVVASPPCVGASPGCSRVRASVGGLEGAGGMGLRALVGRAADALLWPHR